MPYADNIVSKYLIGFPFFYILDCSIPDNSTDSIFKNTEVTKS